VCVRTLVLPSNSVRLNASTQLYRQEKERKWRRPRSIVWRSLRVAWGGSAGSARRHDENVAK
jgi:hypothetical protein